jgi:hypothetical protein
LDSVFKETGTESMDIKMNSTDNKNYDSEKITKAADAFGAKDGYLLGIRSNGKLLDIANSVKKEIKKFIKK